MLRRAFGTTVGTAAESVKELLAHAGDMLRRSASAPGASLPFAAEFEAQRREIHARRSKLVEEALRAEVVAGREDAFYVVDMAEVHEQHQRFLSLLPRVEPFFAMKCNPDPVIVSTLAQLGAGFDCASPAEFNTVIDMGVSPDRIIYAHPCKHPAHVRQAASRGVGMVTFDNTDELHKIAVNSPDMGVVLRLRVDDSKAACQLGLKFGAHMHSVPELLRTTKDLNLNLAGVSFHVGSGQKDASAFTDAVRSARTVFDMAHAIGLKPTLLDIGGGFPGRMQHPGAPACASFDEIARDIRPLIDELFPVGTARVIAEPGRYYVAASHSLATSVVGKRRVPSAAGDGFMYYLNDGVYGAFNCTVFDHAHPQLNMLLRGVDLVQMSLASSLKATDADSKVVAPGAIPTPMLVQQQQQQNHARITMAAQLYSSLQASRRQQRGMAHSALSPTKELFRSSLWGPTCDSVDVIAKDVMLPEMEIGDWVWWPNMGAYTAACATSFNGFAVANKVYVNSNEAL